MLPGHIARDPVRTELAWDCSEVSSNAPTGKSKRTL